ncbi:hypothetical protein JCM19053_375 [Vibrio sp. JCM 19053]|nr:hypothetical protein JCM19053_375 [Vibrio sp. JCM 19053]
MLMYRFALSVLPSNFHNAFSSLSSTSDSQSIERSVVTLAWMITDLVPVIIMH